MAFSPGPVGQILNALPASFTVPLAVKANVAFPTAPVVPTFPPSQLEISVMFDTSGTLSVVRTYADGHTSTEQLNAAAGTNQPLAANGLYTFDVPVDPGEKIQLQYSVDASLKTLKVHELAYET